MSTLRVLQLLLYSVGVVGMGVGIYWFYRRPSRIAISVVTTASVFALMLGHTLPVLLLAVSGSYGSARVIEVHCEQGQKHHIRYQFSVGVTFVEKLGRDGYGNPTCESIKTGYLGRVTYLPNDPTVHVWGIASIYLRERIVVLLLILIVVPIVSYTAVMKRVGGVKGS